MILQSIDCEMNTSPGDDRFVFVLHLQRPVHLVLIKWEKECLNSSWERYNVEKLMVGEYLRKALHLVPKIIGCEAVLYFL